MYQIITDPIEKAEFLIKLFSHKSVANDKPAVMGNAGLREHEIKEKAL